VTWHAVRVWPTDDRRAAVLETLVAFGSTGVQDEGSSLLTYMPYDIDIIALRARLGDARVDITDFDDRAWETQWRGTVVAHTVGAITVSPPWLASGDGLQVVIDPGMAFGTGEHATTRGVLHLMQAIIRPGDVVADLGAGSAVLGIAAAALGATRVAAIEMDAEAIGNAEENVARNDVGDRVRVIHGDAALLLPLLAPVRVVLANIISSVLIELLPAIGAALSADGAAVLSGILTVERDDMLTVLGSGGWRVTDEIAEGEWWSVAVRAPAPGSQSRVPSPDSRFPVHESR
jgi:ribosomal protein L11 methyltransferase